MFDLADHMKKFGDSLLRQCEIVYERLQIRIGIQVICKESSE